MIGVEIDSGLVTHWQLTLGVGELIMARYMVSLVLLVTIVTLDIGMCEEVSE